MLVLSRRLNEKIVFPTLQASVQVVAIKPGVVRLGVEAPNDVPVFREEILGAEQRRQWEAPARPADALLGELLHLTNNRLNSSTVGLALLRRQLQLGRVEDMAATLDKIDRHLQDLKGRVADVAGAAAPAPAPRPAARRRALVVEDDRNECELLAGVLRLAGIDVDTAGDGADALDSLRTRRRPDVVLMDMILPRCDGPTAVRAIRQDPTYAGLKIIGVTGAPSEDFGLEDGPAGVDRWFRKPFNPEDLLRELDRLGDVSS